ncbi:hypothetical protein [Facklamia hominis]
MDSEDKAYFTMLTIAIVGVLLLVGMTIYVGYMNERIKLEQPKYFIELKGNVYELKEVE